VNIEQYDPCDSAKGERAACPAGGRMDRCVMEGSSVGWHGDPNDVSFEREQLGEHTAGSSIPPGLPGCRRSRILPFAVRLTVLRASLASTPGRSDGRIRRHGIEYPNSHLAMAKRCSLLAATSPQSQNSALGHLMFRW